MEKWIKSIKGTIPYTNKTVDIELNGKNLIVTGANGSGKTSLLKSLYLIDSALLKEEGEIVQRLIKSNIIKPNSFTIKNIENNHENFAVDFVKEELFKNLYKEKKAVFKFYEEKRLSKIKQPRTGQPINADENKLGNELEQHLVNLKTRASLAITEDKDQALANKINSWIIDFEKNLKILFEDSTLKLSFKLEVDKTGFEIIQKDKPPFTFQTLSAGYRAIFDIYADLLMHTEYFKIMPNELTGVVLIDEIDSHLHVSLQRLILPFFTQSFPKIQFIVTTHSPFVLMSTPDTVIFDLAKNEAITEDLSYYTYSAVMKGLWNVKPISIHLENSIKEIAKIANSEQKDYKRLRELVENTRPYEDALDSESKVFLMLGMETLEEGGENV